jgi:ATP-dependent Clp protease protease subunit
MQLIRPQVSTICVGMAASMATVLLCAGATGKRFALPNATIHMHQAAGGVQGQAADMVIAAREITRQMEILKDIFVKHTGQPREKITHDTDRDYYLNSQGAKEYGIIDDILEPAPQKAEKEKVKAK